MTFRSAIIKDFPRLYQPQNLPSMTLISHPVSSLIKHQTLIYIYLYVFSSASDLLTCDSDYWLNINCLLDSRAIPNRTENITYQLEFDMKYYSKKY